jgi:hypothetical protein
MSRRRTRDVTKHFSKSTTFVVELTDCARVLRALLHVSCETVCQFRKKIMRKDCSAAIRQLDATGKLPVPRKGWTPSEPQKPWQDRRTLISHCDQCLAILRMVFVFEARLSFVNP